MAKVLFLGVEGSGKSCLTAALASYFEAHAENGWSLRPENKEAFAFSTRMPKRLVAGELPAQTARFRHLRWSLCYKDEPQRTLDVLDYPGEVYRLAFLDPEDDPHPETLKARQTAHAVEIRELMTFAKDADQIFVLFNLSDAKNLETDDQNIDAVWVTVQTLKILGSLESKPQLTLLITQADRLAQEGYDISDVSALLKKCTPVIGQYCKGFKTLVVSALDAENSKWGVASVVEKILPGCGSASRNLREELKRVILKGPANGARFVPDACEHCEFPNKHRNFSREYYSRFQITLSPDDAICFYDLTFWGGAKKGVMFEYAGIRVLYDGKDDGFVSWKDLTRSEVIADGWTVQIGTVKFYLQQRSQWFVDAFCAMLNNVRTLLISASKE